MKHSLICSIALVMTLFASAANAQDKDKDKKTHTVKSGFFEVIEEVTAVVESKNMTEITPNTDTWKDLEISDIVEEGAMVAAGDQVVAFKVDKLDRKLQEAGSAMQQSELSLKTAQLDLDLTESTYELDQQLAERKKKISVEDFEYFTNVDRPNREKSARKGIENAEYSLEYAQEEFNQLERMYKEDELTEESEEIVLKRTKRDVENRQFYLEQSQIRATRTVDAELPREAEQKLDAMERAKLEHAKALQQMPLERNMKRVTVEKAATSLAQQRVDYDKLKADRERMKLGSPAAGTVYYGRCVRGKWLGQSGPNRELNTGKSVATDKPVMTIVDTASLQLRADLTEKQLARIREADEGLATPAALPGTLVTARVSKISYVPVQENTFDCQLELIETPDGLMPGMTCKVRFVVQQNDSAIVVPESAVFTDNGVEHYVYVVDGDGNSRRAVEIGLTADKKTEITSGLSVDEKILTERP